MGLQTPIPLYPIGQQRCFWILRWGCLNCTMPKYYVSVLGWRPKHPYHCTPQARKGVSGYLGWLSVNCLVPQNIVWVLGWRSKHPYLCTPQARKGVSGYLKWWCLKRTMPKNMLWVLGWRPKHPYHCTLQLFWIPRMVMFETHRAKKNAMGSGVAPQIRIPLHTLAQKRCSGYLKW